MCSAMSREKSTKVSEARAGRARRGGRGWGFVVEGADEGGGRRGDVAVAPDATGDANVEVGERAKAGVAASLVMTVESLVWSGRSRR